MANQTQPEVFPSIRLRPALNSSKNTALAAFSPDIIPLDQVKATPAELISAYNYFIAHAIDLDEPGTLIYIRGKQHGESQAIASLRAVPNELVLWPQVWGSANIIGQTGFELDPTINHNQVAVGAAPILYSPIPISSQEGHSHATLIATSAAPKEEFSVPPVKNWRDLVEHVGKNTSLAFYNVEAADPCSRQTTLTTKFRLIENEASYVELFFGIETTGIPTSGIDASLNVVGKNPDDTLFSFAIDRRPLSQTGLYGIYVKVPSGFEGSVILEVFNDDLKVFGDYSSISIVVYAVDSAGDVLLGAEHLVFDSNPRVKRLARKYNANIFQTQEFGAPKSSALKPPFYFRSTLSDDGTFPRIGNPAFSPDIQPLGTVQDRNPAVTLGDFSVDVSNQRKVGLESNTSNYIYLRGTTTTAIPLSGQTRLFYVTGSILLHPNLYSLSSHTVFDIDSNGNRVPAYRRFQTNSAQQFVITRPFTLDNLAPPPDGDHYCLVAEALPDGVEKWPHELVDSFATAAEFATWILNVPGVAWRNVAYVANPNPDDQTVQTSFTIPAGFSSTDQWQFQVQAVHCPIGSSFSVTSDDPDILFPDTPVETDPTIATSAFTGKSPGYTVQVTIHYHSHGHPAQSGQSLDAVLIQIVPLTGLVAQVAAAASMPDVAAIVTKNTVIRVGKSYPNIVDPEAPNDGRSLRIGGAIRARSLGEAHDDSFDSLIPILRGIVVGTDRMSF